MNSRGNLATALVAVAAMAALSAAPAAFAADPSGAYLVKDIYAGDSADPNLLMAGGSLVYFVADDGVHGRELWRTDGTEAGTLLVADAIPGSRSSNPETIGYAGGYFYFDAKDQVHGRELWRTSLDGTSAKMLKNITPGKNGTFFDAGIALGNKFLFEANADLYVTDGTSAGTHPIGPAGIRFTIMGGRAYYMNGSNVDFQLMRTDGTAAGTRKMSWKPASLNFMAATESRLYMLAGGALWVSDGTQSGTVKLTSNGTITNPDSLITAGDKAFFLDHQASGDVLWRSNGTPSGTKVISALPGTVRQLYSEGGAAYAPVDTGSGDPQIWVSWGTVGSTHSIASPHSYYPPEEWATLNGKVYFQTYDYDSDTWSIWQTDGTTSGTAPVATGSPADGYPGFITAAGGRLIFSADDNVTGREIWAYQPQS
jgi:ELWxxDGT repeat protein